MTTNIDRLPKAFIWRRLHSLTGLWFVLFLIEHLITNSQAALLLGDSGKGFVHMVNAIHNLPYLTVIEVLLLGVPILIHTVWGVRYALTSKFNSFPSDGSKPHLKYNRNHAYTWQRITSWMLLVLVVMHVIKFRFLEYPETINKGSLHPTYFVTVTIDSGLYTVADRLNVDLVDPQAQEELKRETVQNRGQKALLHVAEELQGKESSAYSPEDATILQTAQKYEERQEYLEVVTTVPLKKNEVIALAPSFGTASLMAVRDTFKSPFWVAVYTVFVLSACFHAFNGLWTSMLTWGWVIKVSAQTRARQVAIALMLILTFLGLAAVWGTYFLNLKH